MPFWHKLTMLEAPGAGMGRVWSTSGETANLPAVISSAWREPSPTVHRPNLEFLAQLIAARDHLPPQRLHRRAELHDVHSAYVEGSSRGVPRLHPGFFADRPV